MKTKLLMIQHMQGTADRVSASLESYHVKIMPDLQTASLATQDDTYGVVIAEWGAFGYNLDYFGEWIAAPSLSMLPFIILTENDLTAPERAEFIRRGADYVFPLNVDSGELLASVDRLIYRTKQFEQIAFRDALTGVYNRRFFDQHISMELDRARRTELDESKTDKAVLSLSLIDIDRFKQINDTYGHPFGDVVLKGLGQFLSKNLRPTNFLARLGGEEFVILFPDTPEQQAGEIMSRVLQTINVTPIAELEGSPFFITFSGGVVQWQNGMTAKQMLEGADEGLYKAKQNGRNRIELAHGRLAADEKAKDQELKYVLIVDDDERLRQELAATLELEGIKIRTAESGEHALELLGSQSFHLCLIDDQMPKMDGLTLMKKIRLHPERKCIRVIMMQTKSRSDEMIRYLNAGADDCLTKPINEIELEFRVKALLGI